MWNLAARAEVGKQEGYMNIPAPWRPHSLSSTQMICPTQVSQIHPAGYGVQSACWLHTQMELFLLFFSVPNRDACSQVFGTHAAQVVCEMILLARLRSGLKSRPKPFSSSIWPIKIAFHSEAKQGHNPGKIGFLNLINTLSVGTAQSWNLSSPVQATFHHEGHGLTGSLGHHIASSDRCQF